MNPFEKALLNEIPADEAADFFLRVTGRDKLAQAGISAFVGERAALLVKKANAMAMPGPGMSGGVLKPPGPVAAPAAPMLSPSAQGQNTVMQGTAGVQGTASVKSASDKTPHDVGKERAATNLAAEFEKEKGHRYEGSRQSKGRILGALG